MPVTQGRTRQQIRQSVGAAIGALNQDAGAFTITASSGGSTSVLNAVLQFGAANEHRGKWVAIASDSNSSNVDAIRRVTTSETSSGRLSLASALPATVAAGSTGTTFELWDEDMPPQVVNDFINQAITEVTRKGSVSATYSSFHTGGGIREFPLDSAATGIQEVEYRYSFTGQQVVDLDSASSLGAAGASVVLATEDYMEGAAANLVSMSAGASTNTRIIEAEFNTVDISNTTHVELWMKPLEATGSSNYVVKIMSGTSGNVVEALNVPALSSNAWQWVSLPLTMTHNDTAVDYFTLFTGSSSPGSNRIWLDDVTVTNVNTERFIKIPRKFWSLDKSSRTLRLSEDMTVPYTKLRLNGVRAPNLLTTDSAVSEIDSQYIINAVVAKALRARADRRGADRDAAYVQADRYESLAQVQRQRMNSPSNIRWLDD